MTEIVNLVFPHFNSTSLFHAFLFAELETYEARVSEVQSLVDALPEPNKRMLELLLRHLEKVSNNAKQNMMSVSNLGVCFGPTLLRNEEETVAAIMDIKVRFLFVVFNDRNACINKAFFDHFSAIDQVELRILQFLSFSLNS